MYLVPNPHGHRSLSHMSSTIVWLCKLVGKNSWISNYRRVKPWPPSAATVFAAESTRGELLIENRSAPPSRGNILPALLRTGSKQLPRKHFYIEQISSNHIAGNTGKL